MTVDRTSKSKSSRRHIITKILKLSVNPDSWLPQFCALCIDERSSCEICPQAIGMVLSELCNKNYNCVNPSSVALCCPDTSALGWPWLPVCMWYLPPCLLSLLPVDRVEDLVIVQFVSGKSSCKTATSSLWSPSQLQAGLGVEWQPWVACV